MRNASSKIVCQTSTVRTRMADAFKALVMFTKTEPGVKISRMKSESRKYNPNPYESEI
jgi:hypothetical protein